MDIIVTVPKSELKNVAKEEAWAEKNANDHHCTCFWKMGRLPKNINPGDRVYFIHNGHIVNYNVVTGTDYNAYCEVTGRDWDGPCLVMKIPSVPLKNPVPMKGFQGFRYTERIE